MNRSRLSWWHLRRGKSRFSQGPEAALFHGLRVRLTLWYCGVLGAALVLFSVILYFGVWHFLLTPVEDDATLHASLHMEQWLRFTSDRACSQFGPPDRVGPPPYQRLFMSELVACFDQNGSLMQNAETAQLPAGFLDNTLAKTALHEGMASDTVDGGGTVGLIYRYALA